MLTADAGISKSSFYKFFSSKELLFLEIANDWEMQVIAAVNESLKTSVGTDDKRRAANMVYTAFTTIHALGICNFLCDDLPELARFIPEEEARSHYLSSAQGIFDMLHHAEIHFTQPDGLCWPRFRFCICPSSTLTESARTSSPRCGCWSWAHARSWWRNGQTVRLSRRSNARLSS